MYEIFPLLAGIAAALVVCRLVAPRLRPVALVGCALAFGFLASLISGELAVSWGFLLVDTALVLLAALVTAVFLEWWRRRSERPL